MAESRRAPSRETCLSREICFGRQLYRTVPACPNQGWFCLGKAVLVVTCTDPSQNARTSGFCLGLRRRVCKRKRIVKRSSNIMKDTSQIYPTSTTILRNSILAYEINSLENHLISSRGHHRRFAVHFDPAWPTLDFGPNRVPMVSQRPSKTMPKNGDPRGAAGVPGGAGYLHRGAPRGPGLHLCPRPR